MFESKATETKKKDPAEMTLMERMALFERNKGEPPLIPKAPLSMSVSKKQLEEKEVHKPHHAAEGIHCRSRIFQGPPCEVNAEAEIPYERTFRH